MAITRSNGKQFRYETLDFDHARSNTRDRSRKGSACLQIGDNTENERSSEIPNFPLLLRRTESAKASSCREEPIPITRRQPEITTQTTSPPPSTDSSRARTLNLPDVTLARGMAAGKKSKVPWYMPLTPPTSIMESAAQDVAVTSQRVAGDNVGIQAARASIAQTLTGSGFRQTDSIVGSPGKRSPSPSKPPSSLREKNTVIESEASREILVSAETIASRRRSGRAPVVPVKATNASIAMLLLTLTQGSMKPNTQPGSSSRTKARRKSNIFAPANYKHLHRDPSGVPTRPRSYQADHTGSGLPNAQGGTLATPEESQLGMAQCENNLSQSPGTATTDLAEAPRVAHNRQKHMRKAPHPSSISTEATADALDVMAEPGLPPPGALEASEVLSMVPPISRERYPDISSSSNPGGGQPFPGRSSRSEFSDLFERLKRSTSNSTQQRRPAIDVSSDELSGESQPTVKIMAKVKKTKKGWKKYAAPRAATSAVTYAKADAPSYSTIMQAVSGATAAEEQETWLGRVQQTHADRDGISSADKTDRESEDKINHNDTATTSVHACKIPSLGENGRGQAATLVVKQSRDTVCLKRPSPIKERCSLSSSASEETLESPNSSKKRKTSKATIGSPSQEEGPSGVVQTSNRLNNTITITETVTDSTNDSTNAEDTTSMIQAANVPRESLASPAASNDPIECSMQIPGVLRHGIIATKARTAIPGDSAKDVPVTEETPVLSDQSSVPGIALDSTTAVKLSPMVKTTRSCKTACQSDVEVDSRNQTNVAPPADLSAHHACRLPIFYNSSASPQREPYSDENLFEPRFEVDDSPQTTKTAMKSTFDGDESGAALDLMLQIMQYEQEEAKLNREEAQLKLQITQYSRKEVECKRREAKMKLEMLIKKREPRLSASGIPGTTRIDHVQLPRESKCIAGLYFTCLLGCES